MSLGISLDEAKAKLKAQKRRQWPLPSDDSSPLPLSD